ncbi:hypothetical protein ACFQZV_11160 [Microbacterium koreense]|uniref:Transporter n=1 Tax=Microbacterium koreense TaxID=323761 RepID=A0ABW2ZUB4_9MICO
MNDDTIADSRRMLELMEATRRKTVRQLTRRYALLFVVWAVAWAVGFFALWITSGVGALDILPPAAGWVIFIMALAVAVVWSTVVGIRAANDGISGRSQLQGALYGNAWTVSMIAAWLLILGLQRNGLPDDLAQLLYPAIYVFLVGVLYLAGGALWRAVPMFVLGVILIVVAVVATFIGTPTHYLVYATVGPAAMLVVAALMLWGPRRVRESA